MKKVFLFQRYGQSLLTLFLYGGAMTASQILILREILTISQGNELTIGLVLCIYLIYFALGSYLVSTSLKKLFSYDKYCSLALISTVLMTPFVIFALSHIRLFFGLMPTELVPVTNLIAFLLIVLLPCCISFGASFPLLALRLEQQSNDQNAIGIAYIVESFGSGLISLLGVLFVFQEMQPINVAFFISAILLVATSIFHRKINKSNKYSLMCCILFALIGWGMFSKVPHNYLKKIQWGKLKYHSGASSKQGYLEAVQVGQQMNIYENGSLSITYDNNRSAREILSIVRLQNRNIENILLLGGGVNGFLEELEKESFKRCDYVELNEKLISFAQMNQGNQFLTQKEGKVVFVHNIDDRVFVKKALHKYDLIIVNKPPANTLQNNRFYTAEFYQSIKNVLSSEGILMFEVPSSGKYLTQDHVIFLSSLYQTVKSVLPSVDMIPGETCIFVASRDPLFVLQEGTLESKKEEHFLRLLSRKNNAISKKQLIQRMMKVASVAKINHDFNPILYIYNILQGEDRGEIPFLKSVRSISRTNTKLLFLACMFVSLIVFREFLKNKKIILPVFAFLVGLTSVSMQIMVLLLFQLKYGFLFFQIGVLTSMFMLGISLGSIIVISMGTYSNETKENILKWVYLFETILPLLLVQILAVNNSSAAMFNMFSLFTGMLSGIAFPLLVHLKRQRETENHDSIGKIYSYDLVGASFGFLIVGPILIGVFGLVSVGLLLFIINFIFFIGFNINLRS